MSQLWTDGREQSSRFPVRLLAAGYASGAVAGVFAALSGSGLLAALLTFWLGGAAATLAIGILIVYGGAIRSLPVLFFGVMAPSKH